MYCCLFFATVRVIGSKYNWKNLLPNIILFIVTLVFWNYTVYEIIDVIIIYLLDMLWILRQNLNTYTIHYYPNVAIIQVYGC